MKPDAMKSRSGPKLFKNWLGLLRYGGPARPFTFNLFSSNPCGNGRAKEKGHFTVRSVGGILPCDRQGTVAALGHIVIARTRGHSFEINAIETQIGI